MPPAAAPAGVPPRVFTAISCTATRLTRGTVGFDEGHDWWHVPDDSPILESFSTIATIDGLAGNYLVEGAVLLSITLPPCSLAATPLVRGVSVGRGTLEDAKMGVVILTLANLGAFGIVFNDVREYYQRLGGVVGTAPQAALVSLVIDDADVLMLAGWRVAAAPFVPAVAAVLGRAAVLGVR